MKTLQINGVPNPKIVSATVEELVAELGLIASTTLIEHNGIALHRRQWPFTSLKKGDCVEILRIVAGG